MTQTIHYIVLTITAPDHVNLSRLPDHKRRLSDKLHLLNKHLHSEAQQFIDDKFPKSFYLTLEELE
tara:strand:- start:4251 stop:4448 length:198 start_codon:yes stop_codon:yes gene_type:complete